MFDNRPTREILAWVEQGRILHQRSPSMNHAPLSLDSLLIAGFCNREFERANEIFRSLSASQQNEISKWVGEILAANFEQYNFHSMLGNQLCASLMAPHPNSQSKANYYLLYATNGQQTLGKIRGLHCRDYPRHDLQLWEGIHLQGDEKLTQVVVDGVSHSLLEAYDIQELLIAIITLGMTQERGAYDTPVSPRLHVPEGACALVESGVQGSVRVLWANTQVSSILKKNDPRMVFKSHIDVTPGCYAVFSPSAEKIEIEHLASAYYLLQCQSTLPASDVRAADNFTWVDWKPSAERPLASDPPFELNDVDCVDVRLNSGEILAGCNPWGLSWGAYGRGSIMAYRLAPPKLRGVSQQLIGMYERYLEKTLGTFPFAAVSESYTRQQDWELTITETRHNMVLVSSYATNRHDLLSQAVQQMAYRLISDLV